MNEKDIGSVQAIKWEDGKLFLLDQRLLPRNEEYIHIDSVASAADAITSMVVRGAPAIGVTAAYAIVLAATARYLESPDNWKQTIEPDLRRLGDSRPTAVNLRWAIDRMCRRIESVEGDPGEALTAEAVAIHGEDIDANLKMGELGASFLEQGSRVLTHCNAGALATGGYGTALGVIRSGYRQGRIVEVYADETRPWLQGARLTAWELDKDGIPVTLIPDSAAAYLMSGHRFDWVIVGSDRIAANGDVANKIGTYSLAVNARHHGLKFMVVAPTSTIDMQMPGGTGIPIENRDPGEVTKIGGQFVAPENVQAENPVFDVTPAELVDVIVTEKGVVERPDTASIAALMA